MLVYNNILRNRGKTNLATLQKVDLTTFTLQFLRDHDPKVRFGLFITAIEYQEIYKILKKTHLTHLVLSTRDRLESDSANMRKLDEELNQIKRQISQKNKENSKIIKELDSLAEKRDVAKTQIGKFFSTMTS